MDVTVGLEISARLSGVGIALKLRGYVVAMGVSLGFWDVLKLCGCAEAAGEKLRETHAAQKACELDGRTTVMRFGGIMEDGMLLFWLWGR